ncbi:L-threonine aldolase [Anaerospora hongkongensis]|uniref:L-threonine aldolase n=1 Tax=Anaerospora hongkongensis TaxID=244830 RepID=A0A4R1QA79_9FIRM|nr:low specificity L-threonine aldolase [Anaerospora hongkongensis]TCL38847.1 L-threonine aldolase [Anaerospora hongkongensis]
MIDLRSDTVTKPTREMREAMYNAEVGDDGYGEDPTVNALEKLAAEITGKEAALFVTSGTLGNQVAVCAHVGKCDEVICDANAHIFGSEGGGISAHSGAQARPLTTEFGKLKPEQIEDAIRPKKLNSPRTALITVENTCNHAGGTFYTVAELAEIKKVADKYSLPVHMDGARIFNAAVAQNVDTKELCEYADSVQFCLSKGLCAPVGSLLVGSKEFIQNARRHRRIMGGGMRQAGIIAAAGIVALKTMIDRLHEDHEHAYMLAIAIENTRLKIDLKTVKTNIVMCDTYPLGLTAAEFVARLVSRGVRASEYGKYKVRMVTHHDVTKDDIIRASESIIEMAR